MVEELLADEFGTETVTLVVGPEMQKFVIHKQLLISRSTHFGTALTAGFKEGIQNVIHLEEDDPAAVKLIIQFLYTGKVAALDDKWRGLGIKRIKGSDLYVESRVPTPTTFSVLTDRQNGHHGLDVVRERSHDGTICIMDHLSTTSKFNAYSVEELRLVDYEFLAGRALLDSEANEKYRERQEKHLEDELRRCDAFQTTLLNAITLADIWCWKTCHDALIESFIDGEIILNRTCVPLEFVNLAYESLCAGSPLRKVMLDLVSLEIKQSGFPKQRREELVTQTHNDFVIDLLGLSPLGTNVLSFMAAPAAANQFRTRVEKGHYYLKDLKTVKK